MKKGIVMILMAATVAAMAAGCGSEKTQSKDGAAFGSFATTDLDGNAVTEDIFAEADLTVVNVWGTFCEPCIEEMPELAEWDAELPENVQIIGLVCDIADADDAEQIELAKQITESAGVEYTQLIAGGEDLTEILSDVVGVPTTIFVDKDGNVVGDSILGADVEGYKTVVNDYLSK